MVLEDSLSLALTSISNMRLTPATVIQYRHDPFTRRPITERIRPLQRSVLIKLFESLNHETGTFNNLLRIRPCEHIRADRYRLRPFLQKIRPLIVPRSRLNMDSLVKLSF
jgi:hypothetical protein